MKHHSLPASLLILTGLAFLGACASSEPRPDDVLVADFAEGEEVICRRQRPVGSHIPVRICKTRAQIEADHEAAIRKVGPLRTMMGSEPRRPPN